MTKLAFYVPNNEEGRKFLKLLTKFRNKKEMTKFRVRGRGKNRKKKMLAKKGFINMCHDIDIAEAEWYAVYELTNEKNLRFEAWRKGFSEGFADAKAKLGIPDIKVKPDYRMFLRNKRKFNFEEV